MTAPIGPSPLLAIANGLLGGAVKNRAKTEADARQKRQDDLDALSLASRLVQTPGVSVESVGPNDSVGRAAGGIAAQMAGIPGAAAATAPSGTVIAQTPEGGILGRASRVIFDENKTTAGQKAAERAQRVRGLKSMYGLSDDEAALLADNPTAITALSKPAPSTKDERLKARIDDLVAGGMSLDKANAQARLEFGEMPARKPAAGAKGSPGAEVSHLNPIVSQRQREVEGLEKRTRRPSNYDILTDESRDAFSADSTSAAGELPSARDALRRAAAKRDSLAGLVDVGAPKGGDDKADHATRRALNDREKEAARTDPGFAAFLKGKGYANTDWK